MSVTVVVIMPLDIVVLTVPVTAGTPFTFPMNCVPEAAARVTVTVYVFGVVPSSAVTTTVIVLLPTARLMLPDADPLDTAVPFTVTAACDSFKVGVTGDRSHRICNACRVACRARRKGR